MSCKNIPQLNADQKKLIEAELTKTDSYAKEDLINVFVIDLQRNIHPITTQEEIEASVKEEIERKYLDLSLCFETVHHKLSAAERILTDSLSKKYKTQLEVTPFLRQKKILSEQIGAIEGLFFDIMLSQSIGGKLSDMVPFDKEPFALSFIQSDFIIDQLREENTRLIAKIEDDKKKGLYNVHEVPPGSEDFFEKIIQSYKGEKILVDFWATWCGPCKSGMKDMEPKKKELQDKGIVFLYFAGENSPKKDWENYIPTVSGEHFRVTKQQWDELQTKFGIKGIPFYLIYNENGELIHRGHSNAEILINKLK